jgi:hypothetical protein
MNYRLNRCGAALFFIFFSAATFGDIKSEGARKSMMRADGHAPIGVMGDHVHKEGEWMFSYRYMYMDMKGNRDNSSSIAPDRIVTTQPNRFFGSPGQPPTLRVVPTKMTMEMHMLGAMYAPTDWFTLMVMTNYQEKEMDHLTYMGGTGTTIRGTFTTNSDGFGDTSLSGLFKIFSETGHEAHVTLGGSIPTGSTSERDNILTPMGTTPRPRLPYAMQLGSGTFDLLPGITYRGTRGKFGWGAQYSGNVRTGKDNGYRLGNMHKFTAWASYQPIVSLSGSARVHYISTENINGIDETIALPVQTADPNNYGGDVVNFLIGANWVGAGALSKTRVAIELGLPISRNLNGPQMETDLFLTGGLQVMF